jgi:transcriptional regulator with XRE-family HTH domain
LWYNVYIKEYQKEMVNINVSLDIREFVGMKPRIKDIRLAKGLMQKYCAEKAGISQQLWSAYEQGTKYPRIDRAYEIAAVLNVEVGELYEGEKTNENNRRNS